MKFMLSKTKNPTDYWTGEKGLPPEINVMSYHPVMSEFELLSIICTLHGHLTAFDVLTGADSGTEKDKDINAVIAAFQMYIYPKMPLSNYTSMDKRIKIGSQLKPIAIDSSTT